MNILEQELFDQAATQLSESLKKLDKFYLNEKSLSSYLEYMADKPLEEWQRFQPKKTETERGILENISHLAALLINIQGRLYNDYIKVIGGVSELIDKNQKQELEIKRLKSNALFWHQSFLDSYEIDKETLSIALKQIA